MSGEAAAYGLFALIAGAALALQAAINAELSRHVGSPILATAISFSVGTVLLWLLVLALGLGLPSGALIRAIPIYALLLGGTLGSFYLCSNVFLAPRLGVAAMMAIAIAGQLCMALALDHFGALGLAERLATPGRLAGVAVMMTGVAMIRFL